MESFVNIKQEQKGVVTFRSQTSLDMFSSHFSLHKNTIMAMKDNIIVTHWQTERNGFHTS